MCTLHFCPFLKVTQKNGLIPETVATTLFRLAKDPSVVFTHCQIISCCLISGRKIYKITKSILATVLLPDKSIVMVNFNTMHFFFVVNCLLKHLIWARVYHDYGSSLYLGHRQPE